MSYGSFLKHTSPSPLMKPRSNQNPSVFLGYDLPDYITKDDIISFMIKFKHVIVDVEVVSNKRWGNYAKVTFQTASDAHMALNHYNGQCWFELNLIVCLKPWKDSRTKKTLNPAVHTYTTTYDDDDESNQHENVSYLPPYPSNSSMKIGSCIVSSEAGIKRQASHHASCENLAKTGFNKHEKGMLQYVSCENLAAGFSKGQYEYTIKLSGLKMNVKKQEITELVVPFGELTSSIKIVSYPNNGVCYAYANFCTKQSAVSAVSYLNKSEFGGRMIHVCHKGELEVVHSCNKELKALTNPPFYSDITSKGTVLKDGMPTGVNTELDKAQTLNTILMPTYAGVQEARDAIQVVTNKPATMPQKCLPVFPITKENNEKLKLKKKESSTLLVPKKAFPVVKSMSKNLQCYVQERLKYKLLELLKCGGNIEWSDDSIIISGIDKKLYDNFDQQNLSFLGESTDYMSSDNWNKLISVNANATSFISQLISDHLEVNINLNYRCQSVTIVGPKLTVVKVRNKILDKIYQELSLLEYQMLVLVTCIPNMVEDVETKLNITVKGFAENSTCLKFEGENVCVAHKYVVDQIALCKSREFPCNMDTSLVIVAINHFKKVGIAVVVCNTDSQRLLPILLSNRNANINVLVVHSLSVKEIDHAIDILKMSPYKKEIALASKDTLPKLQKSITECQSMYSIYLQATSSCIVIQGYTEDDVIAVSNKLLRTIDDLRVKTITLNLSKEELQFLNHVIFVKPTGKATQVLSILSKSLKITVKNSPVSIELTGTSKAITDGKKIMIQELLKNFQVQTVSSRCHPNFLSQIDKFVRKPLEEELNVVVYYFQVHGSERFTHGNQKTVIIYTKVYSTDDGDFTKACEVINKLDPRSYFFSLAEEEFECLANSDAVDISTIGNPYRVRIDLRHNEVGVMLHALTKKEADDCYRSLKQHLSSSLKLVNYIEITVPQLKFLQLRKPELIKLHNVQIENVVNSIAQLKLEGKKSQVESSSKAIKKFLNRVVTKSHKCVHHKYLLMWKKCWKSVSDNIISNHKEVFVKLNTSVFNDSITCEIVVVGEAMNKVDDAIYPARRIDGSVRECIMSTDVMGVKIVKEGLSSGKVKLNSNLIFHYEAKGNNIIIVSPYCTQADEVCRTVNTFLTSEKEERKVVKKLFEFKHSFSTKKVLSQWNEVLELAKSNKILCVTAVTDPCGGIEVKGTEAAIKQAEPHFLKYISSLESDISCSKLFVSHLSRPALRSPEFIQLCKELQSDLPVSLTVQLQPEVLSSASVPGCDITVEICEGSIALENSDVFINFTDENLTMSKELKDIIGETAVLRCENYVKQYGHPLVGKAVGLKHVQKVVHAVLPKWFNGYHGENKAIVSAVTDSLKLVVHFNAASVSLLVLSCVDKKIPFDFLAKSCLSGIHQYCMSSPSVPKIRVILPIDMAKVFQTELLGGTFCEWIKDNDYSELEDTQTSTKPVEPVWLWKDDDGKFYAYQTEENTDLNKKRQAGSFCSINIGRFKYIIDFVAMTQTNIRTKKVRQVQCVTGDYLWFFKNELNKWQRFSPSDSMKIEVMYVTKTHNSMIIDGQRFSYDFLSMMQLNEDNPHSVTNIKRIAAASIADSKEIDSQYKQKSSIIIFASPKDKRNVEMKLRSCFKTLKTIKCVNIQQTMVPVLEKHIKRIQREYRVEISASSESFDDGPVKYNIQGYKECVQEATTAVYQVLATISSTPVQQSFPKPLEWEPQTDPIELKPVSEGSPEWNKILLRVRETMPYAHITSIKRIQNEFLWEKYCQHKERMSRKGSERVNEMELFHGSSSTAPEEIYKSEEGFDMRFSRQGMWGQGNYFAENAQYSSSYAYKNSSISHQQLLYGTSSIFNVIDSTRQIFLVKVLAGDSYSSPSDKTLRMPPYKPSLSFEKIRYDTVNGMAQGSKVYITYSNDKAYPLYLISY